MLGTTVNAFTIIAGSIIGLIIKARLPERFIVITFQGIGLFNIFLGISMAFNSKKVLILAFSLILGSIIGELIDIDKRVNQLGEKLRKKIRFVNEKFSEGMTTAFMIYCVGSMTILGSIEDGLGKTPTLLLTKAMLDGFAAIVLTASLGIGVMFSAIPLFIFQGTLTLSAKYAQGFFTSGMIQEITAVGGILLLGLGISLLEIKKLKIVNMLPSLAIVVFMDLIF